MPIGRRRARGHDPEGVCLPQLRLIISYRWPSSASADPNGLWAPTSSIPKQLLATPFCTIYARGWTLLSGLLGVVVRRVITSRNLGLLAKVDETGEDADGGEKSNDTKCNTGSDTTRLGGSEVARGGRGSTLSLGSLHELSIGGLDRIDASNGRNGSQVVGHEEEVGALRSARFHPAAHRIVGDAIILVSSLESDGLI